MYIRGGSEVTVEGGVIGASVTTSDFSGNTPRACSTPTPATTTTGGWTPASSVMRAAAAESARAASACRRWVRAWARPMTTRYSDSSQEVSLSQEKLASSPKA